MNAGFLLTLNDENGTSTLLAFFSTVRNISIAAASSLFIVVLHLNPLFLFVLTFLCLHLISQ